MSKRSEKSTPATTARGAKRSYSQKTIKILFAFSGNRCAEPSCKNPVIASETEHSHAAVIGQISHIFAAANSGPRGKPGLTPKERNAPDNLILLCPTHHVVVDSQHETYPAPLLREWKEKRERPYRDRISASINDIGYKELEFAAQAVLAVASGKHGDLATIPPQEKIAKNGLGQSSSNLLLMGAAKSKECEDLIVNASQIDPQFGHRLRLGFVNQYKKFRSQNLAGDDLFLAMYDWAGGDGEDRVRAAAGLCILAHLFIVCDVFEK